MANNIIKQIKLPNGTVYDIDALYLDGHSYEDIVALIDGSVQYLGLVSAVTGLSATASKGDFYRAAVDFDIAHAGDLIIALVDNPIQDITEDISVEAGWGVVHGGEFDMDHVHNMNHDHDFTFENANVSVSGTPQGTVAISVGTTGTVNYTPGGTVTLIPDTTA